MSEIERKCDTVKINIRPWRGYVSKKQFFAVGPDIEIYTKERRFSTEWNGPEQEIEIKVYKQDK